MASANYHKPAILGFMEGTSSQKAHIISWDNQGTGRFSVDSLTNYTTYGANSASVTPGYIASTTFYMRVTRTTTTYAWFYSYDGYTWIQVHSGSIGFTPTKIGIGCNVENATYPVGAAFNWFRSV